MIRVLNEEKSVINHYIAELRDKRIQKDSLRFRRNLERIGEIMAYEISKTLNYSEKMIETPLGISNDFVLKDQIVLGTILRAGLAMHSGLLNYFDKAENGVISAFRKHTNGDDFEIKTDYLACPSIENKVFILSDPMLATGSSFLICYKAFLERGIPAKTHLVSVIGSRKGVDYVMKNMPPNTTLWIGAIDDTLNEKSYIVPGLGDAGDLAYGEKI